MNDLLVDTFYVVDGMTMPRQLRDDPRIDQRTKEGALSVWRALPGRGDAIELWAIRASADEGEYVYRLRVRTGTPFLDELDIERLMATEHVRSVWPLAHGFALEVHP